VIYSTSNQFTHITGNFLIPATGSFLNGAGLGSGEDRNVTVPKTFRDGKNAVPYVSAQAWKRWLRNTVIEETGWPKSEIMQIGTSSKGTTNKIGGMMDPVLYPEDDIFGYMRAEKGQGKSRVEDDDTNEETGDAGASSDSPKGRIKVKAVMRASPFAASLLISIRNSGWQGRDEGFVHLQQGTPQPYTTEFYNTHLQGVFCLNYSRLCSFSNLGDRIELEESKVTSYLEQGAIRAGEEVFKEDYNGKRISLGRIYEMTKAQTERKERAAAIIQALAVLRGGAKQAAFGTSVEPQAIIIAGLRSGNPVFHHMFKDSDRGPELKINAFRETVADYGDRIVTPTFVGIRDGYLANEADIRGMAGKVGNNEVRVTSPLKAAQEMATVIKSS
jgi:CRISPR-associated protein Cst2